jgi:hypothetical protein
VKMEMGKEVCKSSVKKNCRVEHDREAEPKRERREGRGSLS